MSGIADMYDSLDLMQADINDCASTLPYFRPIKNALQHAHTALYNLIGIVQATVYDSGEGSTPYMLHEFLSTYTGGGETDLSWQDIVNAWLTASEHGSMWTIGMIDYMRKRIWDKPFSFPLITQRIGGSV